MSKLKYIIIFILIISLLGLNAYLQKLYKKTLTEISQNQNSEEINIENITPTPTPFPKTAKIILGGDVLLGRNIMITALKEGDVNYPFVKVSEYLNIADLVFVNLENPVIEDCPEIDSGFTFCSLPEMLDGLAYANIKLVNIANNHILNYGNEGLDQTKKYLKEKNIDFVGEGNIVKKEINGNNFSFIGLDLLTNQLTVDDLNLIKKAKESSEIVIVGVHWGEEYTDIPNEVQKIAAKKIVEYGADVVVGHHPHWVQTEEEIDGKKVYYSLGNFVFDQMWSEETKKGMLVELTFEDASLKSEKKINTYIKSGGQVEIVE